MSLPLLHRSLTTMGFAFAFAILASVVLLGFSLVRPLVLPFPSAAPTISRPVVSADPAAPKPAEGADQSELEKEVVGLRQDLANLNAKLDARKDLPSGGSSALLQFFGPRSSLVPEAESVMRVRNAKAVRDGSGKQIFLNFELHNVDPRQRQERGYIVALGKTPDNMVTYPAGVFAPNQNIVLDFTKGETFAVSRFRQARANFPAAPLEGKRASYQILLFGTDGRVLANQHVEESR